MKLEDLAGLAKAHPNVVTMLLIILGQAAQKDSTLVPDFLSAMETRNYARFAIKHLTVVRDVLGALGAFPEVQTALSKLLTV